MVNIEEHSGIHTQLHGEVKERKAGVFKSKFETPVPALQSPEKAIKKKNAECLTELVRFKRRLQEVEDSHAKAMATIQERQRAAQENYDAAQEKYRAKMAAIAVHTANPAYEFTPGTQNMEQQHGKINVPAFIMQAALYAGGIAVERLIRFIKRKFLRQNISCGESHFNRPIFGRLI